MAKIHSCTIRVSPDRVPILEFRGKYLFNDWGLDFGSQIRLIEHSGTQIIFQDVKSATQKEKWTYTVGRLLSAGDLPRIYIKGHFLVRELAFKQGVKFQATRKGDLIILDKIPEQQVQYEQAQKGMKKLERQMKASKRHLNHLQTQLTGGIA